MYIKRRSLQGFTLIETIVSAGILAALALSVTVLIGGVMSAERRNRAMAEVESQGNYVLYQFAQSARNSTFIASPATSTTASSIRFVSAVSADNPTVFGLSGTAFTQKKGVAATTTLTSNTVTMSNLSFQNVSATGTDGAVRITFTLTYLNPTNRSDMAFSQTFYTTVTLR